MVAAARPRRSAGARSANRPSAQDAPSDVAQRRFQIEGAFPTKVALRLDPRMPFEQWRDLGPRLSRFASASAWWLGDWLVFGRDKYDRRYKLAAVSTALDYQTLRNYAVVARRFPPNRRRELLTFQHHAEVCALEDGEQERWLDLAEQGKWSRNELRRRLRCAHRTAVVDSDPEVVSLRIGVERAREERWRQAAEEVECPLLAWLTRVADDAAASVLGPAESQNLV
jgi:hypothetical protein